MAQAVHGSSTVIQLDCRQRVWPALMQAAKDDADVLELAAELATTLARERPGSLSEKQMQDSLRQLTELPAPLRMSLGYLLVERDLREQADPGSAQIAEITAQIERLRASFVANPPGS